MDVLASTEEYEWYLRSRGFAQNTITSYVWVAAYFARTYGRIDAQTLSDYRSWLIKNHTPGTANQRIQAINRYLAFEGRSDLKLRGVRVQARTYLDKTISDEEYDRLIRHLLSLSYGRDYCAVRLMSTTGVRVSELLCITIDDIRKGYLDLHCKGKCRRVHIPAVTCEQTLAWLREENRTSGPVFLNRFGKPISSRGLSMQLKRRAEECAINKDSVHPHAFRHLFARRFLQAGGSITLLADILGHSSMETTRIYLRQTSSEQLNMLNRLVSW